MNLKDLHLHWGECKYKDTSYRSYSLARPYRENGKNRKEIVLKLGIRTRGSQVAISFEGNQETGCRCYNF